MKNLFILLFLTATISVSAQIPKLNSMPGANGVIFLDFDGQTVTSGYWNGGNTINCASPNLSTAMITEAFDRVAEDYKIFNINITTDSTKYFAAPATQRIRIIITPTNFFGAAGVAYTNSFIWGDDTPGFVFTDANVTAKFLGEGCSHESGHSLGCAHQSVYDANCTKIIEYNAGQGSGEIGWAPIMGYSVDRFFSTWYNGKSSISCSDQDDIAMIASRILPSGSGLKADDVVNTYSTAPSMAVNGINLSASGLINNSTDVDVFKINVTESSKLKLKFLPPANVSNVTMGNLDILVNLLNSTGAVIKSYNTLDSLSAKIDTTLNTGVYYISVDGTSNANINTDYGSGGSYAISGTLQTTLSLPIYRLDIRGTLNNNNHVINWNIQADEPIVKSLLEYSTDGVNFNTLQQVDYRTNSYSYKPFTSNTIYYRMKSYIRDGSFKTSNIITLQSGKLNTAVQVLNNTVNDQLLVTVKENINYELVDMNGSVINKGSLLTNKVNIVNTSTMSRGIYILKAYNNNNVYSQRILKD